MGNHAVTVPFHPSNRRCIRCRKPSVQAVKVEQQWPLSLVSGATYPPSYAPYDQSIQPWVVDREVVLSFYENQEADLFVWDPFCSHWRLVLFDGVMCPTGDGRWYQTTMLRVGRDDDSKVKAANDAIGGCTWSIAPKNPDRMKKALASIRLSQKRVPVLVLTDPVGRTGYLVANDDQDDNYKRNGMQRIVNKLRKRLRTLSVSLNPYRLPNRQETEILC